MQIDKKINKSPINRIGVIFIVTNTVPTRVKYFFFFGSLKTFFQLNVSSYDCNHDLFMQIGVEYNIHILFKIYVFRSIANYISTKLLYGKFENC